MYMYLVLLLLLRLSRFSHVRLSDPTDGSLPGSSALGFSTQEYLSGSPFPSPMHASMLSRFSRVRLHVTLWQQPTRLLSPQDSLGRDTGVGCHFLLQYLALEKYNQSKLLAWIELILFINHGRIRDEAILPHIKYSYMYKNT